VGLYKLNPVDPYHESAWFQPLNLKCDILVSNFAFKCNLYRYNAGASAADEEAGLMGTGRLADRRPFDPSELAGLAITDDDFTQALTRVQPSAQREVGGCTNRLRTVHALSTHCIRMCIRPIAKRLVSSLEPIK
jgi:hypothetical protein